VLPEIKQLASTFSKLRKLSATDIFVELNLVWTIVFLEAAPSLEILHITVNFDLVSKTFGRWSVCFISEYCCVRLSLLF
jgi:hypothetical protein